MSRENRIKFTKKRLAEIEPTGKRHYYFDEKQKGLRLLVHRLVESSSFSRN